MTYNQFTVLVVQHVLLVNLQAVLTGHPDGNLKIRTDLVLNYGVPDILREPTYGLHVSVIFLVTSRTGTFR